MRNITTIILICILSFPAFGQETDNPHKDKTSKSIYLELLGASNMIGVSYPDFVNVSPKNHLQIMGRYVDVVS